MAQWLKVFLRGLEGWELRGQGSELWGQGCSRQREGMYEGTGSERQGHMRIGVQAGGWPADEENGAIR